MIKEPIDMIRERADRYLAEAHPDFVGKVSLLMVLDWLLEERGFH